MATAQQWGIQPPDQPTGTPSLNAVTPPPPTPGQRSWLGVDPKTTLSAKLAQQGLQGYLGGDLTPHMGQVKTILQQQGYTDPTFGADLTGAQDNALLQAGAQQTGNLFTPWSTTDTGAPPGTGTPGQPSTPVGAPPPALAIPEYQGRGDFSFDPQAALNDPNYQWRFNEGQRALEHAASAKGMTRGTNHMRDLIAYGQGTASNEVQNAYNRARDTFGVNQGEDRFKHGEASTRAQLQYAPSLLGWERDRDDARYREDRGVNLDWEREQYGRDDAWRRHTYAGDDAWRRYELEEDRRNRMADRGLT